MATVARPPSISSAGPSGAIEPLYQVKLLSALRSGDPAVIHPFLTEISKDKRKSVDGDIDTGAAALHLAIRCGSAQTVSLLLAHRAISPNGIHPPHSGTTPLHLAASLGRLDIVSLLLEQDGIDDSLRDRHGKTCRDVARSKDIVRAIDDSRAFLNASFRSLLRSYILSPINDAPATALIQLLESPRVTFVDLSYLDNDTGTSLLHEAAKRKDLRLIELAVRAGADVFIRNRRGKMAYEGTGKDDRVRVFLRQFANHDKTLIPNPTPLSEPPVLKGYLNKYTNVAKGYNTRWFVLKNGVLSYYRHQDDETIASRGSISMKNAVLHLAERTRFEVHSLPARSSVNNSSTGAVQKWYMKANHPVEAHRWTEAIGRSIEWCKQRESGTESDVSSIHKGSSISGRRKSTESDTSRSSAVRTAPSLMSQSRAGTLWRKSVSTTGRASISGKDRERDSMTGSSYAYLEAGDASPTLSSRSTGPVGLSTVRTSSSENPPEGHSNPEEGEDGDAEDSSSAGSDGQGPPYQGEFDLHGNAVAMQLELTVQLFTKMSSSSSLSNYKTTAAASSSSSTMSTSSDLQTALQDSLNTTQSMLSEYLTMARARDSWWARALRAERRRQTFWEASLAEVVREGEGLERELRARSRRRGSRVFGPSVMGTITGGSMSTIYGTGLEKKRPSVLGLAALPSPVPEESLSAASSSVADGTSPLPTAGAFTPAGAQQGFSALPASPPPPVPVNGGTLPLLAGTAPTAGKRGAPSRTGTMDTLVAVAQETPRRDDASRGIKQDAGAEEDEDGFDTDEEDEFFDAIETNNLPNLLVYEGLASPPGTASVTSFPFLPAAGSSSNLVSLSTSKSLSPTQKDKDQGVDVASYAGYETLRTRLPIGSDQRPSTNLWSVLKHSIGKDLTKISFPVFFNEPTSMLQRMAEDMEFSECLDVAAHERDPLRRIAFVAAFAMSNYSSTIGRIAKPFNPMLSETFEYVRLDKQYRYVSEQVSHHPPISACWAESPSWHYFGEVDAQNKFMGKSFEIRPTGVAHAHLLLPEDVAPGYPKAQGTGAKGKVVEHYSWKKVTTNVSGFILGSPTIDHYGDMLITNHRTGDQCKLTFKPRGWRGRDAYEISGQVIGANGRVAYEIAGRWNSQLVAKQVGVGSGQLHPDISVTGPNSPSVAPEYILLWRNSEKPVGSPFNLTPFALTLNDCPQGTLKPFVAPTDCRLRPDQRAFELGRYELANGLKQEQEKKQRAIRKAREEGTMPPHRPRWFSAETDGDTGERVWAPSRTGEHQDVEYWVERERVWRAGGGDGVHWKDVDPIFIEEPREVTDFLTTTK